MGAPGAPLRSLSTPDHELNILQHGVFFSLWGCVGVVRGGWVGGWVGVWIGCRGVASPDCPGGQSWWASRWRVSANCAHARTGGCLRGDVPPSEAGRFWNFDTEFTQFSDNFYAKFIPLEMFKYLWNIMFIIIILSLSLSLSLTYPVQHFLSFLFPFFPLFLSPFSSLFPFLLFSFPFLSFFSSSSSPFPSPFPFLSLSSSFPFLFSLPFPLFSFLSPFFPFPIFALLPDFWCPGGSLPPLPPHWLRPWLGVHFFFFFANDVL